MRSRLAITSKALIASALLILPPGEAWSQADSAAAPIDSVAGYLSHAGSVPLRILYVVDRTDSTVSLTLVISDQLFETSDVQLSTDSAVFDWVPGDETVHCILTRADDALEGDCTGPKGGDSLHLTMELDGAVKQPAEP